MKNLLNQPLQKGIKKAIKKLALECEQKCQKLASDNTDFYLNSFFISVKNLHSFIVAYKRHIDDCEKLLKLFDQLMSDIEKYQRIVNFQIVLNEFSDSYTHIGDVSDKIEEVVIAACIKNKNEVTVSQMVGEWQSIYKGLKKRLKKLSVNEQSPDFGKYTRELLTNTLYQFELQFEAAQKRQIYRRLQYASVTLHELITLLTLFKKTSKRVKDSRKVLADLETMFLTMDRHTRFMDVLPFAVKNKKIRTVMLDHKPISLENEQFDKLNDTQIILTQLHNLSLSKIEDETETINYYFHHRLALMIDEINQAIIMIR